MRSSQVEQGHDLRRSQKIRAVFCTSGGVLGATVMDAIAADERFRIVGLVRSSRVFRPEMGFVRGAAHFFLRCGILYTIYLWLITTAAEVLGKCLRRESWSVGVIARRLKIRELTTRDVNSPEGHAFLRALNPHLLISAHFDQKLGSELCDGAVYAAVNLHPSLLPAHRGVDPVFQSLLAEDQEVGVTLHRLSEELDQGRILDQQGIPREVGRSVVATNRELMRLGAEMLLRHHGRLLDAKSGFDQPGGGTYESWPYPREVRKLYSKGMRLINWKDLTAPRCF
jgi:methionyl-tRNA formyltransferase